jgi:hypothetical protein
VAVRRPASTSALPVAVALSLALLAGCSRCGKPAGGPPPERFVPAASAGVVLVPVMAEASRQAEALLGAVVARPGGADLAAVRTATGMQLGFDLLDPRSLELAGFDPKRGLAIAEVEARPGEPGTPLLVLPVGDEKRLEALVTRLATDRLGAVDHAEERAEGSTLVVWRRAPGEPPVLAQAPVPGSLLVAIGPSSPAVVRAALALDPALSVAGSPAWKRGRAALGDGLPLMMWVPRDAPALASLPRNDGAALGIAAGATGVKVVVAGLLGPQESRLRPLAGTGDGSTRPSPLDPATVVAWRISADPSALFRTAVEARLVPGLPELQALVDQLAPGADVGFGVAPGATLGSALSPKALQDPLRLVKVEAVWSLKDPKAFIAACDRLVEGPGLHPGSGAWRLTRGKAEVAWRVQGSQVALAAGAPGGLAPLLARAAGRAAGFDGPGVATALAGGLGGVVVHGDNLVAALRALPPEAFGSGPDAVVARSMSEKAVDSLGRGAMTSLRADLPEGAIRLTLDLKLGTPAPATP